MPPALRAAPGACLGASLALALALALPAPTCAQDAAPATAAPAKLAEWPALKETDAERVLSLVGQFRKADPQLHEGARRQLQTIGDAAVPLLFQQVSDRAENINSQLFGVLDAMLERRHAALMARELKKPRVELRRYLTLRLCRFADPDVLPVLTATMKDKDEATAFYAALGSLAQKQRDAVPAVLAYTKLHWKDVAPLVAEVLPAARSAEVGNWVLEAITKATVADQMAGLRLLRQLAVKDHVVVVRGYLGSPDHTVKREAVNTMRVLHGEAPIENLTVFQAIEMAKEWQKKA